MGKLLPHAPRSRFETLEQRRKRLLRKAKARWRRKRAREDQAEEMLLLYLKTDGLVTRRGRSALRGLIRRGYTVKRTEELGHLPQFGLLKE